jgi:hypothetical protein
VRTASSWWRALRPHERQVRHVRAGDEQHDARGAEERPEHLAHVTHDVDLERPHVGQHLHLLEHLDREAGRQRELLGQRRQHARHVGVRLLEGDAGLQACEAPIAEVPDERLRAVELQRQHDRRVRVEEAERLRQDADDVERLSVRPRMGCPTTSAPANRRCQ